MLRSLGIIIVICITCMSLMATQFSDFQAKATAVQDDPDALKSLIQEYLYRAQNLEDHRTLQNYWHYADSTACMAHYQRLAREYPNDPEYAYLAIRLVPNNEDEAMQLIAKYPKFYWGYRILALGFIQKVTDEEFVGSEAFTQYSTLVDTGYKEFPEDDYMRLAQAYRFHAISDPERAHGYLAQIKDTEMIETHYQFFRDVAVQTKRTEAFLNMTKQLIDSNVVAGELTKEEADYYLTVTTLDLIAELEGIAGIRKYISENPQLTANGESLTYLADKFLEYDDSKQAMVYIEQAIDMGEVNYPELNNSQTYQKLSDNPQWKELLARAKALWDADAKSRAEKLLATQTAKPASDWELKDINGNLHKLSDMRDYVVILDFWAQWCSPCKMVMPNLSDWVVNDMPRGVKVFSVNVMENDYDKAKAYFRDQKFAMTYLEGNQDVANAYGVRGIPHILIIDRQGNIAWEQVGFSYDLEEKIGIWVEHLSR